MYANSIALPEEVTQKVYCPFCGAMNVYSYKFSADYKCFPKWYQFWKPKLHLIRDHFADNEGSHDAEVYPRKCVCGHDVLLTQKRVV